MKKLKGIAIAMLFIWLWYGTEHAQAQGFSRDECAISVDIWLLGESCVVAGLKARYGEYMSLWVIDDRHIYANFYHQ